MLIQKYILWQFFIQFQNYNLTVACFLFTTLGPWCFLPESNFILFEECLTLKWCLPSTQAHLHIGRSGNVTSKKSWVLRLQKKTWIFQYCTRRRPLDQVFAKVCKSLNEVACLTFSSLILFHAKIPPVNIDSREEMWKNLNRRRISFLQGSVWRLVSGRLWPAHE